MAYAVRRINELDHSVENFPTIIHNDTQQQDLDEALDWVRENLTSLTEELNSSGAILFRGFPVTDAQSYERFFSAFGFDSFTYKESLSNAVRINHTPIVFTANEAPKDVEIFLHSEMAQTPIYPSVISLFCQTSADVGGATVLCRSDTLYQELLKRDPELTMKLERLGIRYTTRMPYENARESGQGRSWKGTLSVETEAEAEAKLLELCYTWSWEDGGTLLAQTPPLPAVREISPGRKSFFNQIVAAYLGWAGARENPASVLCFGDDSHIPASFMEAIVEVALANSYDLEWQDGDVAIVNNHLVMHGRRPYSGDRKRVVLVALGR
ncbi:MAG: TauD/TfdA family dioxygenase [Pseudomonadota bacterium]